ncbi:hypothetical protein CBR_g34604 [Chara braunii]|uniref:RRM domain-containing protein n=1 Tax=Chara braunii TaxID=69332 RepID=A0A388LJ12_CHABU|nr:hypothetical protein CBR_g34604 [Chara braunii]|eukprot:GBG82320.1 hypothetical protein CBR_g34604 [Chara braunii]
MSHFGRSGPPDIRDTYSLLVLNITFRTSADDLMPLFQKYGKVVDIFIPRDRRTGDSRGFAFVRYKHADEAFKAIDRLDGRVVDGREIVVQYAKYGRNNETIQRGRITQNTPGFGSRPRSRSPRRYGGGRYMVDHRDRDRDRDRHYSERDREHDRVDRGDRMDRDGRDRMDWGNDRVDRSERGDRSDRSDRMERSDRMDRDPASRERMYRDSDSQRGSRGAHERERDLSSRRRDRDRHASRSCSRERNDRYQYRSRSRSAEKPRDSGYSPRARPSRSRSPIVGKSKFDRERASSRELDPSRSRSRSRERPLETERQNGDSGIPADNTRHSPSPRRRSLSSKESDRED